MRNKIALMLSFLAVCVWNIHLILPTNYTLKSGLIPFRPEIEISIVGHIHYTAIRIAFLMAFYCLFYVTDWKPFLYFTYLLFGFLIDYVLYYNGTFFYIFGNVPVSYTLIMGISMTFIIVKALIYD